MSSEEHSYFVQWHFHKLNSSTFFHSNSQSLYLLLWFFSILVFVPSLFLCINSCRRRFSQQESSTATTVVPPLPDCEWVGIEFSNHSMVPSSTSMVGADFEKEECCICLSLFQGNENLKMLRECQHVFHSECLDMWLSAHPSCPLCRASLHHSQNLKK